MCGIAGILTADAGVAALRESLCAMQRALQHRGPDDEGTWQSPSRLAAFAHTRLAVLDLSPAGRQPLSTSDGRFTIVLNGEIYNFAEIRRGLQQEGVTFRTRTDAEVVLRAYQVHGDACVDLFRGMFAFALWDERERSCLLARDRFGIKPLYYCADGGRLIFGSEVRALMASTLVPTELDAQALYGYFRTGSVPEPRTLLRHVRSLPAGHHARWRDGRLDVRRYWALGFTSDPRPAPDVVPRMRAALLDSIRHHFVSDVPVGILLSGGVDSTALVALARAAGQRDLQTFSMSLPGSDADEGTAARRVATHFQTDHHDYSVDAATGKTMFRRFLAAFDQPSIDGLNVFAMAGFAREHGMTVTLSGLGADELFGGYRSFKDVPRLARWDARLSLVPPARRAAGRFLERYSSDPRWRRIGDMLGQPAGLTSAYTTFRAIFTRAEAATLVRHYTAVTDDERLEDDAAGEQAGPTAEDTVSHLELTRYVRNQLLRDSDVMSLAWALELRTPFLDNGVVAEVCRIPAAVRLRRGKQLLLDAVPEVPSWVAHRPKRCFQFPFAQWLDGEWRGVFAEVDRTCPIATHTWYRSWSVFMFERWTERLQSAFDNVPAVDLGVPAVDG